ncbi:MAG: carboxypeptidase regulatory-like domain-containing protein [Acidobacteria bacterium]|nr:carboxypeptidase regulatory-like domain-containing protein [Acidobacteriota bacterium]
MFPTRMQSVGAILMSCVLAQPMMPLGAAQQAGKLKIAIIEGEGAINNIKQRIAREPIVEVQDENDRPVAGAVVVFTLPQRGAGGVFSNGSNMMTAVTDEKGRAAARGLKPNSVSGEFEIAVSASYQGLAATARIRQVNSPTGAGGGAGAAGKAAGGGAGKIIAIVAVIGGAAAGGLVASRGGKSSTGSTTPPPPPPTTTISPGTGTVGPPR